MGEQEYVDRFADIIKRFATNTDLSLPLPLFKDRLIRFGELCQLGFVLVTTSKKQEKEVLQIVNTVMRKEDSISIIDAGKILVMVTGQRGVTSVDTIVVKLKDALQDKEDAEAAGVFIPFPMPDISEVKAQLELMILKGVNEIENVATQCKLCRIANCEFRDSVQFTHCLGHGSLNLDTVLEDIKKKSSNPLLSRKSNNKK